MMAARTPRAALDGTAKRSSASPSGAKSDAVQVAVRVRPLSKNEEAQGSESCVDVVDSSVLLAEKQFDFDAALPATTQQESVFSVLVEPMIDQFFDGYNATVFAYGQTGSGKTYTMGNEFAASVAPAERGVIPRVIDKVFQRVKGSTNPEHFVVKLSYLEILNEEIHDLLAKSSPDALIASSSGLSVRGDSDRGIIVSGLSEHIVKSVNEAGDLLRSGAMARATASTSMNAQSSRSHAICTLTMEHHEVSAPEGGTETRFSKFHLVDLAGSERVRRTNSEGARFKEGVNINRGLLALGNVINALCERSRTNSIAAHVPYRDSKLTRLLQDSLGGNSKTLMIACVSPADVNYEETSNTLRYASRARSIENQAVINKERSAENEVAYLKQQLEIVQLQLLQKSASQVATQIIVVPYGSEKPALSIDSLVEENRKLKEELVLANTAKDKWKKIATELTDKIKDASQATQLKTPTSVKRRMPGVGQVDSRGQGASRGPVSRLEQLKRFQSQKAKSLSAKEGAAVKKSDDFASSSKRNRMLNMSPSSSTQAIGKKPSFGRTNSVLPSPGKRRRTGDSDVLAMGAMTALLQQVMASQEAIFSAKEAVRVNVAERKALALKIGQLEISPSSENAEKLIRLRQDLRDKSDTIRQLQQKLASVERTVSLPSGLFPTNVDTCHELICHIVDMLKEAKGESMSLTSYRLELDEKIAAMKEAHVKKTQALKSKIKTMTKELEELRALTTKKKAAKKRKARESYETMDTLFSSSDEEEDNSAADSDYVDDEDRRTSSNKRRRTNGTPASSKPKRVDVMEEIDELLETSAAACCSCSGKCATKACACKSQNRDCSDECSCELSKCRNKSGVASASSPREGEAQSNQVVTPKSASGDAAETLEDSTTTAQEIAAPVTINLMSP